MIRLLLIMVLGTLRARSLTEADLLNIQTHLENKLPLHEYFSFNQNAVFSEVVKHFYQNTFKSYIGEKPILIYPMQIVSPRGWGNAAGTYFQAISCAREYGQHFIGIRSTPHPTDDDFDVFTNELPTVILHSHPIPREEALKEFQCDDAFPWSRAGTWYRQREYIQHTLRSALETSFKKSYPLANGSIPLHLDHHEGAPLPLIPDAVIELRCNDIVGFPQGHPYGFVHFQTYAALLPQTMDTLYILAEPEDYNNYGHNHLCKGILVHLRQYITSIRPGTMVAVLRGHQFLALTMLASAPIAISCPTTFAFWPLISNNRGSAHMHKGSYLICGGEALNMSSQFHWITSPRLVNFGDLIRQPNPLPAMLNRLTTNPEEE